MNILNLVYVKNNLAKVTACLMLGLLLAYLVLTSLVKTYSPSINFDDGWIGAMNFLPFSKYIAGQDYFFTYGPLYFLNMCVATQPNQLLAQLFYVFQNSSIAWALFLYYRKFPPAQFSLFAAALLIAQFTRHDEFRTPSGHDYIPIVIVVLLLSIPLIAKTKESILSSIITGIYAAILMFIKFDLFVELAVTVCFYFLLLKPFRINYPKPPCFTFFATWLSSILLLIAIIFKSPINWLNWIITDLTHVLFYVEVTYVSAAPKLFLIFALVSILILFLVILRNCRSENFLGYTGLVLLPSVILIFKHGFVLPEIWHITSCYKYLLAVFAYLLIFSKRKSDTMILMIPFVCLALFVSAFDSMSAKTWAQKNNLSRLESLKLPENFLPQNREGKTFDSIPYNIMWCLANRLDYKPNPLIILWHASTVQRDKEIAQYFSGPKAADYLFCEHSVYFKKHMFMETPLTWSSILSSYQIQNYDPQKYILLLRKNTNSVLPQLASESQFDCIANRWYVVPQCKNPLYLSLHMKLNFIGSIARLFFALPAISMNLKYPDGHIQNFKLVPGILDNGILINYLPEDMPALKLLFDNKSEQAVSQFELTGPGIKYYETPVSAKWIRETNKVIQATPEEASLPRSAKEIDAFSVPNIFMYSPNRDYTSCSTSESEPVFRKNEDELLCITLLVFEKSSSLPPESLFVRIDNGKWVKTACGIKSPEYGGDVPGIEAMNAGFMTAIDIHDLKPGLHKLQAVALSRKDGQWYHILSAGQFLIK